MPADKLPSPSDEPGFQTPIAKNKCSTCGKVFSTGQCLRIHQRLHTGEKPFACNQCGLRLTQQGHLKVHIQRHHSDQEPYSCHLCSKAFRKKSSRRRHVRVCQNQARSLLIKDGLGRDEATESIAAPPLPPGESEDDSEDDIPKIRDKSKTRECPICKKVMVKNRFKRHLRTHIGEKPFKCEDCGKCFIRKDHLQNHSIIHIRDDDRPLFKCDVCGKNYTGKHVLLVHMRIHTEEKNFKCNYCDKSFTRRCFLVEHERVHTREKPYHCQYCPKRFANQSAFRAHTTVEHVNPQRYACQICPAVLASNQSLKHHMGTHDKPFPCEKCDKRFHRKEQLIAHATTAHIEDLQFSCTVCAKSFGTKANLDYHNQWFHTKESAFKCGTCNKGFDTDKGLTRHEALRCPGVKKPCKCQHCPKTFRFDSDRKKHEMIHTGEKPFPCGICSKGFTSATAAKRHERSVHNDRRPYGCHLCPMMFKRKVHLRRHVLICQNTAWANLVADGLDKEEADEAVAAPALPSSINRKGSSSGGRNQFDGNILLLKKCTVSLKRLHYVERDMKKGFTTWRKLPGCYFRPIR